MLLSSSVLRHAIRPTSHIRKAASQRIELHTIVTLHDGLCLRITTEYA